MKCPGVAKPASSPTSATDFPGFFSNAIRDPRYGWAFDESAACGAAIHGSFTVDPQPIAGDGPRYAGPDASTPAARANACVSTYSRMLVSLPSRTVMAKIQSSSNGLFVALTFPLAKPTTRTRSPCATNSRGSVDVSNDWDPVSTKSANPACPWRVPP